MKTAALPLSARLLLASFFTALTACQFDGEFDWNPRVDAGPDTAGRDAGRPDSGAPVSGQGGSGSGGTGGGSVVAGAGGMSGGEAGQSGAGETAGEGGMSGGEAGNSSEPEGGTGGVGGDPSLGGQGGETQGGSPSDPPVAGQGDEDPEGGTGGSDEEPQAGSGDEEPIAGEGGEEEPPQGGEGGEPEAGQGGAGEGGTGGDPAEPEGGTGGESEPQGGSGGAGQGGTGGEPSEPTEPLHDLEVTAFSIKNRAGFLSVAAGEVVEGSVTYHNPNDAPFPLNQIVIAGRPPGGTNAGGPYLDLIPTLGGPTTIPANGNLTYSATRTMLASDPIGVWRFYPTWEANGMWHDGSSLTMEVIPVGECRDMDGRCAETACTAERVCAECLEASQCPGADPLCCDGTCADATDNATCGRCSVDCGAIGETPETCQCTKLGSGSILCEGPTPGACIP